MNTPLSHIARTSVAAFALFALQGCAASYADEAPQTAQPEPAVAEKSGPALWKVSDKDTTIYLFGTVHALPKDVDWMSGTISEALASSDTLVTEIDSEAAKGPQMQQLVMGKAMNASGGNLRESLTDEQRASYEAAMTSVGMPVEAFDAFKPWFAGITLGVMPLLKAGYTAESGVEMVIEQQAGADMTRSALETPEYQIGVFDSLPRDSQVAFLITTADAVDSLPAMMDAMVAEWLEGDADGLALLMNEGLSDPVLAEALLYTRNNNWAEWIDTRLDTPGTVFVAVGAGHLAGDKSVQDYLAERDIATDRVQ